MFLAFLVIYAAITACFFGRMFTARGDSYDILEPFPGYVFLFSTYFLVGSVVSSDDISDKQWLLYSLAAVGFFLGSIRISSKRVSVKLSGGRDDFAESFNSTYALLLAVVAVGITLYLWSKGGVPLFSDNVDAARVSTLDNGYIATLATSIDVVAVYCFTYLLESKKSQSKTIKLICIFICILFIFIAIMSGSRSRLLKFGIPCFVVYSLKRKKLPFIYIVAAAVLGTMFVGMLGYYRAYSKWGYQIYEGIGYQSSGWSLLEFAIYYAQTELSTAVYGLRMVLDIFPASSDFTYGWLHAGPFLTPFQGKIPIPGNYFKEMVGGHWDGVGLAATFIAPIYVDFSEFGVLPICAIYAFIISSFYRSARFTSPIQTYLVVTYGLIYYFILSGMRSDFISFETLWFIALSSSFIFVRRRRHRVVDLLPERIVNHPRRFIF